MKLVTGLRGRLPVAWDGKSTEWREGLSPRGITHIGDFPCGGCGSRSSEMESHVGVVARTGTERVAKTKRTRSGREYGVTVEVPAWAIPRLHLNRCLDCGHTEVHDVVEDCLWTLEDADYGPDGSWPDQPELDFEGGKR